MTCAQGLLRLLWGGARSWSATGLIGILQLIFSILFCVDVSSGLFQSSAAIHNSCINIFALTMQETNSPKGSNSLTTRFKNLFLLLALKPVKFFPESTN